MSKAIATAGGAKALATLAAEREWLAQEHVRRVAGLEHARALARAMDRAIVGLLAPYPGPADWAVLAIGGYGRGELSPFSDVDLLVLSRQANREAERVAAELSHALWDAKLETSLSVRNLAEALRPAPDDFARSTSYLQSRHLAGDEALSRAFGARYLEVIRRGNGRPFLRRLMAENELRHSLNAEADHGLEPDLKDGLGGLRDIQSVWWAGLVALNAANLEDLARVGYLAEDEALALATAHEFLLRVRHRLHYTSGRRTDRLYFAFQGEVAALLGYPCQNGRPPVEHLMRDLNTQGAAVARATSAFWEHVEDELLRSRVSLPRWSAWLPSGHAGRTPREARWLAHDGRLELNPGNEVSGEPEEAIVAFAEAARRGLRLGHCLLRSLRAALARQTGPAAWSQLSQQRFFSILRAGEDSAALLEAMADCGLLELYLPEWHAVRFLAHHDVYHSHTVDRHSALVVRELNRLASDDGAEKGLPAEVAAEVPRFDLLLLAGLLHDLGKGHQGDHSAVGAEIATAVARRMGLDASENDILTFLVRHHLDLAKAATRRDLEDPSLVAGIASSVQNADRLRMLYLLTIADSVATGPSAWSEWKGTLLRELFLRVLGALTESTCRPSATAAARRQDLRAALLRTATPQEVEGFLGSLPDSYVLSQSASIARRHLALRRRLPRESVGVQVERAAHGLHHELILATADRPGLLWRLCGVFALNGLSVLEARVFTDADGTALDVFRLADAFEDEVPAAKWPLVRRDLEEVLDGRLSLGYRLARKLRPYRHKRPGPERPTRVAVDNASSADYTVVEVHARDRLGLLYAIARALDDLGLSIYLAKVSTRGPEAVDSFYVHDRRDQKVTDPQHVCAIEQAVLHEIESLDR